VVCKVGYELNGSLVSRCLENGTWSSGPHVCSPLKCLEPKDIEHGRFTMTGVEFRSVVKYECQPGYDLIGKYD